jgi:outer membrane protein assembly factor BamE (lipoprotein component of BamABCDE complex)
MKTPLLILTVAVATLAGCFLFIPKENLYLKSAQDRATQEEVQQRLGRPALTATTQAGESVWVYEVREEEPGSRWTSIGMWCDEYVLTFDKQGILRRWTHKSQLHGGELMPTYCVSDGYRRS